MKKSSFRFHPLDGLRGLAAIAVMLYHYTQYNNLHWLNGSWVAVDIFYILSGFVIAHSYSDKIAQGLSFKTFMSSRLIRLGPLYFIGFGLGVLALFYASFGRDDFQVSMTNMFAAGFLNLFCIPFFNDLSWPFGAVNITGPVFPFNDPAWSLFFELFVNILFFVYIAWGRRINLLWIVLSATGVFVVATYFTKIINPGWGADNFLLGFPRVISEFFLGMLIYQLQDKYKPLPIIFSVIIFTIVALGFFISIAKIGLLNALVFAPILIALLAKIEVSGKGINVCKFLGDISYPLYITHFPVYRLLIATPVLKDCEPIISVLTISAVSIVLSVLLVWIDLRIRKAISARVIPNAQNTSLPAPAMAE